MPPLTRLCEFLDSNGVSYQVLSHPESYTAQELAAIERVPSRELAKVVVLLSGSEYLMVVLPAPYHVNLKKACAAIGKRNLEIAKEREFAGLFPNCELGAMPPFGNLFDMPVWVDDSLTRDEEIVFNAGTHTQAMRMKYADFARLVLPVVASLRSES